MKVPEYRQLSRDVLNPSDTFSKDRFNVLTCSGDSFIISNFTSFDGHFAIQWYMINDRYNLCFSP